MINILIADDNDSNLYVLEMLIEEWFEEKNSTSEYKIDSVINGKEALEKIETTNYDIIFLDIMMPVMDGFETLKEIRNKNLSLHSKIIVASAIIDDNVNKNKAKELRANAFIVKPLSYDTIDIMLTKYLKNSDISTNNQENNSSYIYFDKNESLEKRISAIELLKEYPENIIDSDDIDELQHYLNNFNQNVHSSSNIEDHIEDFVYIIDKSRILLLGFTELDTLVTILNDLKTFVKNINFDAIVNKNLIAIQLLEISEILVNWIFNMFVEKDLDNVLEINSKMLNNFLLLKNIVSK